jgi:protocatechuate 3,4-dioxygenase beta subunit
VRQTLIAKKSDAGTYRFDFVLQGENETAFLDI